MGLTLIEKGYFDGLSDVERQEHRERTQPPLARRASLYVDGGGVEWYTWEDALLTEGETEKLNLTTAQCQFVATSEQLRDDFEEVVPTNGNGGPANGGGR